MPRRLKRRRASTGPVLLAALAGFAIVCGLVILIIGAGSTRRPQKKGAAAAAARTARIEKQVKHALKAMQQAEGALNAANFGAVRAHLQRARESLAVVQFQIKESKKADAVQVKQAK